MKIGFNSFQHLFRDQRHNLSRSIVGSRHATIEAAKNNQPLFPLMAQQQHLVISQLCAATKTLLDIQGINPDEVIVYEAGSYSKGTCAIGSDLDLNISFDDAHFKRLYPFERDLKTLCGYLLGINPYAIHNNNLNHASQNADNLSLAQNLAQPRRTRRSIANLLVKFCFRTLKRPTLAGFDIIALTSWAAIRHPQFMLLAGLRSVDAFEEGLPQAGVFMDKVFLGGNRTAFDQILGQIISAVHPEKIKAHLGKSFSKLDQGTALIMQRPPLEKCESLEHLMHYAKHDGGYKTAMQILFLLQFAGDEIRKTSNQYAQLGQSVGVKEILGKDLADEFVQSIEWLITLRAVISIFSNGGPETPTIGPAQLKQDFSRPVAQAVLETLHLPGIPALKEAIAARKNVIRKAQNLAQTTIG